VHLVAGPPAASAVAAGEVVRRYYRVINSLAVDMDPDALAALMTRRCECRAQVRAVRRNAARGRRYLDHVVHLVVTPDLDGPRVATVLVRFDVTREGLVDAAGRQITSNHRHVGVRRIFRLVRTAGGWRIYMIQAVR
jgi:hypothetical protein